MKYKSQFLRYLLQRYYCPVRVWGYIDDRVISPHSHFQLSIAIRDPLVSPLRRQCRPPKPISFSFHRTSDCTIAYIDIRFSWARRNCIRGSNMSGVPRRRPGGYPSSEAGTRQSKAAGRGKRISERSAKVTSCKTCTFCRSRKVCSGRDCIYL